MTIRLFLASFLIAFNSLIADGFADEKVSAIDSQAPSGLASFIPLILICLVFYFLLIKPQQKKMKEHRNTLEHLKVGEKVFTSGGVIGVVKAIDKKEPQVDLEVASGVVIKIIKNNITAVIKDKHGKAVKDKSGK